MPANGCTRVHWQDQQRSHLQTPAQTADLEDKMGTVSAMRFWVTCHPLILSFQHLLCVPAATPSDNTGLFTVPQTPLARSCPRAFALLLSSLNFPSPSYLLGVLPPLFRSPLKSPLNLQCKIVTLLHSPSPSSLKDLSRSNISQDLLLACVCQSLP